MTSTDTKIIAGVIISVVMNASLMLYFKDGAEDVFALEKRAENFLSNDMNCQKIEGFVVAGAYSYSKVYKCNLR